MSTVSPLLIAPWSVDAEDLIRGALRHVYSVKIYEQATPNTLLPITVTGCTLTYDELWAPYVQGELTAVIPDAATLAKLDPRGIVRVDVYAGYVLPGGATDSHLMARCLLSKRDAVYPGDVMTLEFQGPEYIVQGRVSRHLGDGPMAIGGEWNSTTLVRDAMQNVYNSTRLANVLPWVTIDYDLDGVGDDTGWVDPGSLWGPSVGANHLDVLRDVADRVDAWFRIDELGVYRISRRRWGEPSPSHRMRIGADGTIITSADTLARDGWANVLQIRYEWTVTTEVDGVATETPKSAGALIETRGAFDAEVVGMVHVLVTRQHMVSSYTQARNAGMALLNRYSTQANALTISGVAAYWLRPEKGISVQLPVGAEQTLVVSAITFDLDAGRMDIRTRSPVPEPAKP